MSAELRPAFALESYENKVLPEGIQLFNLEDLADHTIKVVITDPNGEKQCHAIFVTETDCWLALAAGCEDYGDDHTQRLEVCGNHWNNSIQTLSQYLSVQDMRHFNLATPAQLDALQVIEDEKKANQKAEQAARLRKRLAELEGGAA